MVRMDTILDPDVFPGLAVSGQHRIPQVDELQVGLGGDVGLHNIVRCLAFVGFIPTARSGRNAGEENRHLRQHGADFCHESFKIREDALGALAVVDVVAADMQDNQAWAVRQDEAVGELDQVRSLERIDAAIDDGIAGQVLLERLPAKELGIAREHDGSLRWGARLVGGFVGAYLFFETVFGRRHRLDGEGGHRRGDQQRCECFHGEIRQTVGRSHRPRRGGRGAGGRAGTKRRSARSRRVRGRRPGSC